MQILRRQYKLLPEVRGGHPPIHCASGRIFCLSLVVCHSNYSLLKHLSLWNISHIIRMYVILKLYTQSKCLGTVILILQHLTRNIRESSSTFNPTSRGDCRYLLCVIFKRYAFSCGKKEWPAGRSARGETIDLDTVTLLPSMPSCAQSFWHP